MQSKAGRGWAIGNKPKQSWTAFPHRCGSIQFDSQQQLKETYDKAPETQSRFGHRAESC
jgi:hypothetical protein